MDLRSDVDGVAQQLLYLAGETEEIQPPPIWCEVDQQVDVAVGRGVPTDDRTEDPDV